MNLPIKLVKKQVAQEAGGNWGEPANTKYELFAELLDPGRDFRTYDAQTQLGQVKKFRIRLYSSLDVTGDWKIEFRGKEWTVISIEQDLERLFYWIITANHK